MAQQPPVWVDVRFDHAASATAADELRRAARRLEEASEARRALIDSIGARWSGPRRDAWIDASAPLSDADRRLAHDLRTDASKIDAASDAAHREQARRDTERAAWFRDRAAAVAAADEAGSVSAPGHPVRGAEQAVGRPGGVGAQAPMAW